MNSDAEHTKELIQLSKKNNTRAQYELYNQYAKAMYNAALGILKDPVLAEEAMQEGFITAFDKLDQYRGESRFGGWLKQIILRKSYEHYHKKHKWVHMETDEFIEQEAPLTYDDTTADARSKALYRALEKLNPTDQVLLKLYYLEGYDHNEIMEITQLSYANCRTRLSRAKDRLKKLIIL